MAAVITQDMLSTDLADYLVGKGVAFREAHEVVGGVFKVAAEKGLVLDQLSADGFQELDGRIESDVVEIFDLEAALERHSGHIGTAPSAVRAQLEAAKEMLTGM